MASGHIKLSILPFHAIIGRIGGWLCLPKTGALQVPLLLIVLTLSISCRYNITEGIPNGASLTNGQLSGRPQDVAIPEQHAGPDRRDPRAVGGFPPSCGVRDLPSMNIIEAVIAHHINSLRPTIPYGLIKGIDITTNTILPLSQQTIDRILGNIKAERELYVPSNKIRLERIVNINTPCPNNNIFAQYYEIAQRYFIADKSTGNYVWAPFIYNIIYKSDEVCEVCYVVLAGSYNRGYCRGAYKVSIKDNNFDICNIEVPDEVVVTAVRLFLSEHTPHGTFTVFTGSMREGGNISHIRKCSMTFIESVASESLLKKYISIDVPQDASVFYDTIKERGISDVIFIDDAIAIGGGVYEVHCSTQSSPNAGTGEVYELSMKNGEWSIQSICFWLL